MAKFSSIFEKLRDGHVLNKSRTYARWTIPALMAEVNKDGKARTLEGDFQSDGAMLVNGLASKLAGLLFPVTHPFMRINLSEDERAAITEAAINPDELDSMLAKLEFEASQRLFRNASYNQIVQVLKHLITTGNACLYRDSDTSRTVCYGLESFAVRRDGSGRVVDAIIKETVFHENLPDELQALMESTYPGRYDPSKPYEKPLYMYTRILRRPGNASGGPDQFDVAVEIDDVALGAAYAGTYFENDCPWIFPAWNLIPGENYGRGLVEDHAGGFAKLSELSAALTLYEIESARLVHLVGAGAKSAKDELNNAETGAVVGAEVPAEIIAYEAGTSQKIELLMADIDATYAKLARAFMYQGNTRDGERITAYEIRQEALEAEAHLGGAYSSLAESLQLPLSHVLLTEVDPEFMQALAESADGSRIDINTGISALGRATKVQNILQAFEEGRAAVELIQQADPRVDTSRVLDFVYQGRSVDTSEIFKTERQLREEAEAEEQRAEALGRIEAAGQMQAATQGEGPAPSDLIGQV